VPTVPGASPPKFAVTFDALPSLRLSEPFEKLRDASDATFARTGARPKVFLASFGPPVTFTERATFAKNFFEAGGIEAVDSPLLVGELKSDPAAIAAAFKASGARFACLCSSDKVYATEAADMAKALTAAGASHIYLAGRPGELEAPLRAAGVGTFVYVGCDVLATLQAAHDILEADTHGTRR
jgi:methylmalonyl-CoA mutase